MNRSISFLTLALLLSGSAACSSTTGNTATTDSGTAGETSADTGTKVDTGAAADTGTDETSAACGDDLPSGYKCPAVTVPAGGTACNEAALQDFATKCVKADFTVGAD